jgi:GNAT superfamily N-acetyltransferase
MDRRHDGRLQRTASHVAAGPEHRASMNAALRPATAADAPRIASLLIDTRSAFMPYAPSVHLDDEVREWVADHLVPTGGVSVAEVQGRVVAAMATERSRSASWITQMAVDPALVGRGIGSLLLAQAMSRLALPLRVYTFQANVAARRFYERHGFLAIELTDGQFNEERCPDVLYELKAPSGEGCLFARVDHQRPGSRR